MLAAIDDNARAVLLKRDSLFSYILASKQTLRQHVYDCFPSERQFIEGCFNNTNSVYIILGSPRSGTSVVKSMLADPEQVLSLPGEHRYYFTLLKKNFPDIELFRECDDAPVSPGVKRDLLEVLFYETESAPATGFGNDVRTKFAFDWASRLIVQWPDLCLNMEKIIGAVDDACKAYLLAAPASLDHLNLLVLKHLHKMEREINPYYYDFDNSILDQHFKGVSRSFKPPGRTIVEISPFIMLRPQRIRSSDDVRDKLLLKSSSDAYRMNTICDLFQEFQLNVINLTRNPLASINGLIDGWDHHCFWQHNLDNFPEGDDQDFEATAFWRHWKFDLYESFKPRSVISLAELCKQQWINSNEHIQRFIGLKKGFERCMKISFESFQVRPDNSGFFSKISDFMGIDYPQSSISKATLINATRPPRIFRWKEREGMLLPLLQDEKLAEMAASLGYNLSDLNSWS